MRDESCYGHMVHEHVLARVRLICAERAAARAGVRTPGQVMRLRRYIRRKLRECFGPFPERTPLNAQVTGTIERPHYRIEKIPFESRPHFPVTANHLPEVTVATLYVPHLSAARGIAGARDPKRPLLSAVDVRGVGELTAQGCRCKESTTPFGPEYLYASHRIRLNEPYRGRRVLRLVAPWDAWMRPWRRRALAEHMEALGLGWLNVRPAAKSMWHD